MLTGLSMIPFLLMATGLVLVTWIPRSGDRHPLVALAGLLALSSGLAGALLGGPGLAGALRTLFVDAGLALLLVAFVLRARQSGGHPFFLLGSTMLACGLLAAWLLGDAPPELPETSPPHASLLVELGPDDHIEEIMPHWGGLDLHADRAFPDVSPVLDGDLGQTYLLSGQTETLEAVVGMLAGDRENVDHVEWNRTISLGPPVRSSSPIPPSRRRFQADDPLASGQWALEAIDAPGFWEQAPSLTPRRRARVAILDTGVDYTHEDLASVLASAAQVPGHTDPHGHGTHCAGIAGAVTNNGIGIASLNWEGRFIEIAGYTALPAGGSGTYETIAQAILDATLDGADVISLSLGDVAPVPPRVLTEAVSFALGRGAIVVASAGNAAEDAAAHTPSNIEGVIAVSALDPTLAIAPFSNHVGSLTRPLSAPGVNVLSLRPGGQYVEMSGTSMATPLVAGLLGVLRSLDPGLTPGDAYELLARSGAPTRDTERTGPLIQAGAALEALFHRVELTPRAP